MPRSNSETTYKLVSDSEAFFDAEKRPSFGDAIDGSFSTIILIEDFENPVNWMKPEGISIEDAIDQLLNQEGCCCGREDSLFSTRYFGPSVGMLDGSTERIAPNTEPETLRRALKCADGHSPGFPEHSALYVVHKPQGYIALGVYLFLLALPAWFVWKAKQ